MNRDFWVRTLIQRRPATTLEAVPSSDELRWTLEPDAVPIPDAPIFGRLNGTDLLTPSASVHKGHLSIYQGKTWPPDLGVTIRFFALKPADLSGKEIRIAPDRSPPLPTVLLRWRDAQGEPMSETFTQGYALKMNFGMLTNGSLPGRVFLAIPDRSNSFIGGRFEAIVTTNAPDAGERSRKPTGSSKD